jgi:outer membrane protein assembly factor BamD
MTRWTVCVGLIGLGLVAGALRCPAPFIYRAGEGWTYESVGGKDWHRTRAKDQLAVAQDAFDKHDYRLAIKAARRTVDRWPFSDYAPQAQYLLGRCYSARKMDEKAFKQYQKLLEKYPKIANYHEVLQRQFEIANRFLAGQWFKLWGYIPFFPSMDKTVKLYEQVIKSGPYSDVAARAQLNIGAAREKQKNYPQAVAAYDKAADRYRDQKQVASEALFKEGLAYKKEAETAEYDQSAAGKAIGTFDDFMALYPEDKRVVQAQKIIDALQVEQARGSCLIARFYERRHKWEAAMTYYNEAVVRAPNSQYAAQAKARIAAIKRMTAVKTAQR